MAGPVEPRWRWLGRIGHAAAMAAQEGRRDRLLAGDAGGAAVLLCEHPPVVTLGRNARRDHVVAPADELARRGVEVVEVSRGGDVTYHGPGQLMVYPVVRLRGGVVAYLEAVAAVLVEVAAELGVPGAAWRRDPAGVWLDDAKLAACGLHLRRGVAVHGFAFNVATPATAWQLIVPCGLTTPVISLDAARRARGLGAAPSVAEVAALVGPRLVARLLDAPS
ncbi:MAG: lipoyl(octanoyl) transferase LipB [Kofleriaceae bacterium]|nr:lipoyl(octanoyl) transferase LipB [Kofleriaceae bacterium]